MELFEGKRKISIFVMDITYRYDKCVFFVPEFQDNILICIYYIFGGFYLLFLVVIPIYLLNLPKFLGLKDTVNRKSIR